MMRSSKRHGFHLHKYELKTGRGNEVLTDLRLALAATSAGNSPH